MGGHRHGRARTTRNIPTHPDPSVWALERIKHERQSSSEKEDSHEGDQFRLLKSPMVGNAFRAFLQ
eukprot:5663126-Pyramimonas_sp.AAC.1